MKNDSSQKFSRALEFHRAGHLDRAEDAYLALLQISPSHSGALHNLGVVLAQKRKQKEAISYFDQAIAVLPDYAEAYNNRGSAQLMLGHLDQALHSYNESLRIKPDYWEASLNLAHALMRLNRPQDALKISSNLLEINPNHYKAQFDCGLFNVALGNLDDACRCFSKTMALRQSEQKIQETLRNLQGSRTIIVAAHRFSTIADADTIICLEQGSIVEQGSRSQLLANSGHFSKWWHQQSIGVADKDT